MSRPRLLFISPRFLFPLDEGGKIRTVGILRAMKRGAFDITLASPAPPELARFQRDIDSACDRFVSWPPTQIGFLARLLALAGPAPVSTASDRSAAGAKVIAGALAAKPDVVVVDFPHAAVLMPPAWTIPSVLFTHNVEAEILERHASVAPGWRRAVWRREARKMAAFEQDVLHRFTRIVAVSARDAEALARRYGVSAIDRIDTGVDLDFYRFQKPRERAGTVVFSGAMDSRSNIDGIEFLLREVWPLVRAARPSSRMHIVGRNPPAALVAEAKAVGFAWHFTGRVEDIRPHLQEGDISVIPLRVGSGTRLKAFEAMALGLPVVSTALGVEGLGIEPGEHYVQADDAASFAAAITRLLDDSAERHILARTGRALLEARFSWAQIGRQFEAICQRAVTGQSSCGQVESPDCTKLLPKTKS